MKREEAGFTRVEFLAVVVVLGAMGLVNLPTGARTKSQADVAACLDHNRELVGAWTAFALDNGDAFADSATGGDYTGRSPWAKGYVDWSLSEGNTNVNYLTDPRHSVLADFLGRRREPFKCPADVFLSGPQKQRGWPERVRSVAANGNLGPSFAALPGEPYVRSMKFSELVNPAPSETFVFTEEHPDSLNDCAFYGPGGGTNSFTWWDLPANYHDGGATFSFADGRTELHQWRGAMRRWPVRYIYNSPNPYEAGQPDHRWIYERMQKRVR